MIRFRMLGTVDLRDSGGRELRSVLRRPKLLVALLWPDLDNAHARNALRQALHALRDALGPEVVVARGEEELELSEQSFWCDPRAFAAALDAGRAEEALELCRGGLLTGLHLSEVPEFERWLDEEREHIRRRACETAHTLTDRAQATGNATASVGWARRLAELSPSERMRTSNDASAATWRSSPRHRRVRWRTAFGLGGTLSDLCRPATRPVRTPRCWRRSGARLPCRALCVRALTRPLPWARAPYRGWLRRLGIGARSFWCSRCSGAS